MGTVHDELRANRIETRAHYREWRDRCPLAAAAADAAGQDEYQREAAEREELARARDLIESFENAYGRRLTIAEARMAVLHGADGLPPMQGQTVLSGTTSEVAAMLRRTRPDLYIGVGPEQPTHGSGVGGVAYGPSGGMSPVGDEAYAQQVMDRRRQQIQNTIQ
jgi:hypothetical protein